MKYFRKCCLFAFLGVLTLLACEKEDICDGEVATPNVKIAFFDRANSEILKPFYRMKCYVKPENSKDTLFLIFSNVSEIKLPLNINKEQTIWNLQLTQITNNDTLVSTEQMIFNYIPKAEYVSKACGYKTVFNQFSISLNNNQTNGWITNLTPLSNNIINEQNPHAKIYY